MLIIFKTVTHILTFCLDIIDRLSKPNPKYTPDKSQQELSHKRNKALLLYHLTVIFTLLCQLITGKLPISQGIALFAAVFMMILSLWLSCRYHPYTFKIIYNLIIAIYGPLLAFGTEKGVIRAWLGAQMFCTLTLGNTGSIILFLTQFTFHLIYINTIYQSRMLESMKSMTPEEFLQSLTNSGNSLSIFNTIITVFIQLSVQNANARIIEIEKKKDEFEKQKIFLLGFSHELRNLINSLMGNIKLASLESTLDKIKEFLKNADLCGELLLHLVNNILDTGKAEVEDLEINPTSTNIHETMERIWNICSELIKRKNLNGALKIHNSVPKTLKVDHYRLTQIFLNLVGNAVKFTDQGSINITLEWISHIPQVTEKCFQPYPFNNDCEMDEGLFEKNQHFSSLSNSFFVSTTFKRIKSQVLHKQNIDNNGGLLKVTVSDTGSGILKEDLPGIFDKFRQVSSDISKRKLGTGLGLFITKQLIDKMKGEIKVFSKKDQGTCFIFCIPLDPIFESKVSTTNSIGRLSIPRGLKAMVVDDEHFSNTVLKNFLTKLNVEVLEVVENGLLAYRKYVDSAFKSTPLRIVTLDLTMPIMDGKNAAEKIRNFEMEKGIEPCLMIIISGNCSESEMAECLNVNGRIRANAFLKKPASIEELDRVISRHFG